MLALIAKAWKLLRFRWQLYKDYRWRRDMSQRDRVGRMLDPYGAAVLSFCEQWMELQPTERPAFVEQRLHGKIYEGLRRCKTMEFAFWLTFSIDPQVSFSPSDGDIYKPSWAPSPFRPLFPVEAHLFGLTVGERPPIGNEWPHVISGTTSLLCALQAVPPGMVPYPFEPPL